MGTDAVTVSGPRLRRAWVGRGGGDICGLLKVIQHSGVLPPPLAVRRAAACSASAALSRKSKMTTTLGPDSDSDDSESDSDSSAGPRVRLRPGNPSLTRPAVPSRATEAWASSIHSMLPPGARPGPAR